MTALYWRHPDSRVFTRQAASRDGEEGQALVEVAAPDGAEPIDPSAGKREVRRRERAAEQARQQERERAAQVRGDDYAALIELGVPARLAARLTGHRPDASQDAPAEEAGR